MKNVTFILVIFILAAISFVSCEKDDENNSEIVLSDELLISNIVFDYTGSRFSIYKAALLSDGRTVTYGTMGSYNRGLAIIGLDGKIEKMIEIDERINILKVITNSTFGSNETILVGGYSDSDRDGSADAEMAVLKVYDINLNLLSDFSPQIRTQSVTTITGFATNQTNDKNEIFIATGTNKIVYHDFNSHSTKSTIYTNIGNPQLTDIYLSESINNSHNLVIGGVEYEDETSKKSVVYKGTYNSLSNEFVSTHFFYDTRNCNELCKMLVSPYNGNIVLISEVDDYSRPNGNYYWSDIKIIAFDKNGSLINELQIGASHSNLPTDAILINGTVFISSRLNAYYYINTKFAYGFGAVVTYDYNNNTWFTNYFGNPNRDNGFNTIFNDYNGNLHLLGYRDNRTHYNEDYSDWYADPEGFNAWYCILPYGSIYEPPPLPPNQGTGD